MTIGLDLTTFNFRSLRADGRVLAGRSCRADVVPVGKTPMHRQLLDQLRLSYAECDSHLLIWGEQAGRYHEVFHSSCLPLLIDGEVPENQPPIRQMLAYLIEGLLPTPNAPQNVCGVAFAQSPSRARAATVDFLTQLVNLAGYRVAAVPPAQALALAELSTCHYSGLVLHLGSAASDFCAMHHGTVLWRESLALRESLPAELLEAFRSMLMTCGRDAEVPEQTTATATSASTSDDVILRCRVMQTVMERHFAGLTAAEVITPASSAIPLVLGGECPRGSAIIPGLKQDMASLGGPIPISEVRWPVFGDHAVARGCLIHAELESQRASRAA